LRVASVKSYLSGTARRKERLYWPDVPVEAPFGALRSRIQLSKGDAGFRQESQNRENLRLDLIAFHCLE